MSPSRFPQSKKHSCSGKKFRRLHRGTLLSAFLVTSFAVAQTNPAFKPINVQATAGLPSEATAADSPNSGAPLTLTLQDALKRAKSNSPQFQAALTELGLAKEDHVQARAALLPNVNYNNQFIYTEGGNPSFPGRFIANNGVHEYISQANVHQALSLTGLADYQRTRAMEAAARARSEIAARGLVVTVVKAYYGLVIAQRKYATAQNAASEAERFLGISQKLEQGGEVAHADVIKAQIQFQQAQRDLQEARLDMDRSRLELAILLFPNFNENFTVIDDLQTLQPLPSFPEVQAAAARKNPELRAAVAALQAANHEVTAAWGGLLPSLTLDYFYGIDASHFAVHQTVLIDPATREFATIRNLGYSATATLLVPVWGWGANRSKVRQANLRQHQASVELSFAQRQLLSNVQSFYNEAQAARSELESLTQAAQLSAESLRLTTLRYQAGEATVLEVVDAQTTLRQARNAYDDGQARFRLALATLQTLTGNF